MNIKNNSSVLGLGTDILEIDRIRTAYEKWGHSFLLKLFTLQEQSYFQKFQNPVPHIAGRFCAKEAIVKALGVGFGEEIGWLDIDIQNDTKGKPVVLLSSSAEKLFFPCSLLVSISHSQHYVSATALWLG